MKNPLFAIILACAVCLSSSAAEEKRLVVGKISAELIFASATPGDVGEALSEPRAKLLATQEAFKGLSFRHLGRDQQQLYRSYVNWLAPLGASKQILIEFDTLGVGKDEVRLTLKLWQNDKVILKTDIELKPGKPLIIQGPAWKGGRVLVVIDLLELKE